MQCTKLAFCNNFQCLSLPALTSEWLVCIDTCQPAGACSISFQTVCKQLLSGKAEPVSGSRLDCELPECSSGLQTVGDGTNITQATAGHRVDTLTTRSNPPARHTVRGDFLLEPL